MNLLPWFSPPVTPRQVSALAGVAQAVALIDDLAQSGQCSQEHYNRNIYALLLLDPEDDQDVLGPPGELNTGLQLLRSFCQNNERSQRARYLAHVLYLQKRLMRREDILEKIRVGIEKANRQLEFYGVDSDALALSLEDLYQQTLSTLGFRIQIYGQQELLSQQRIAAKVRSLLFSGVRFALLWRQFGGHSRQLLLSKRAFVDQCTQLLENDISLEKDNASN